MIKVRKTFWISISVLWISFRGVFDSFFFGPIESVGLRLKSNQAAGRYYIYDRCGATGSGGSRVHLNYRILLSMGIPTYEPFKIFHTSFSLINVK
jgi:hypothetical protein